MKIVFFGSSKYSAIAAQIIQEKLGLSLVVTHSDKPAGRARKMIPSPLKYFAQKNKIPYLTFDDLNQEAIFAITKHHPDFLVVADYGKILPKALLDSPKFAALNIHHSLLPKYRGPAPAPAAILAGDKKTGVTIIKMTKKVDAGDILAQKPYTLKSDETTGSLLTTLNKLGGQLAIEVINSYLQRKVKSQKQNESQVTYTHRLKKENGQIDLKNPPDPQTFDRMIRAFYPWPGTWCRLIVNGKWLIVKFLPPTILQPEGKRPMSLSEFKNGYSDAYDQISNLLKPKAQS